MYNNKVSRAYRLREFCGGGDSEPNDALKNVKCSETTTSRPTGTDNASPVSKGAAKGIEHPQHSCEGAASRWAWWIIEWHRWQAGWCKILCRSQCSWLRRFVPQAPIQNESADEWDKAKGWKKRSFTLTIPEIEIISLGFTGDRGS